MAVFQQHPRCRQSIADFIGAGEVLVGAGLVALLDQRVDRRVVEAPFGGGALEPGFRVLLEQAEKTKTRSPVPINSTSFLVSAIGLSPVEVWWSVVGSTGNMARPPT